MELVMWKGEFGLPSLDSTCLTVLAYCKFSGVPLTTTVTSRTMGQLPVLKQDGEKITNVEQIFNHLRKQHLGADFSLSDKQSADNLAYTALIEEKLVPALEHALWVDKENYARFTRSLYAKALTFPLGMVVPNATHNAVARRLYARRGGDVCEKDREYRIYKDARECLSMLSTLLGEKDFFFGDEPTSLDALVFGYLAPLLKFPLPNPTLQNHAKACTNLVTFCNKILEKYLPLSQQEEQAMRRAEEKRRREEQEQSEFPHKTRTLVLSALVAVSAMVVYALAAGIVHIEVSDDTDTEHAEERER